MWSVHRTGIWGLHHEKKIRINAVQIMGKCNKNGKVVETHTHTHHNCQAYRPYPPPRNFYTGIRRIRKVVLENIGGGGQPPPLPPFPALLFIYYKRSWLLREVNRLDSKLASSDQVSLAWCNASQNREVAMSKWRRDQTFGSF